jgi:hypothetical protein
MWSLLIPLASLITAAKATEFAQPVQIDFIRPQIEHNQDFIWHETTDPITEKQKQSTREIADGTALVGQLVLSGTDDGRTFNWSNPDIDEGKQHQVSS